MKPTTRFSLAMVFLLGALFFKPEPSFADHQWCIVRCNCETAACATLCVDEVEGYVTNCQEYGFCAGHPNCP